MAAADAVCEFMRDGAGSGQSRAAVEGDDDVSGGGVGVNAAADAGASKVDAMGAAGITGAERAEAAIC